MVASLLAHYSLGVCLVVGVLATNYKAHNNDNSGYTRPFVCRMTHWRDFCSRTCNLDSPSLYRYGCQSECPCKAQSCRRGRRVRLHMSWRKKKSQRLCMHRMSFLQGTAPHALLPLGAPLEQGSSAVCKNLDEPFQRGDPLSCRKSTESFGKISRATSDGAKLAPASLQPSSMASLPAARVLIDGFVVPEVRAG